jgi:hypothetical protein
MTTKILKIDIDWHLRKAIVTSLTGGHVATFLDLGRQAELTITEERRKRVRHGKGLKR